MSTTRAPPLAGRPPYATDEDDAIYDSRKPIPRPRKQNPENPNNTPARESVYKAYDHYFDNNRASGVGAVGMGLMNGDLDDSDDENPAPSKTQPATNKSQTALRVPNDPAAAAQAIPRPQPAAVAPSKAPPAYQQPVMREVPRRDGPKPTVDLRVNIPPAAANVPIPRGAQPREPAPAFMQPPPSPAPSYNPHPLGAPPTPITPVFARPSMDQRRDVKFSSDAIMRGNSEETLLARSTAKGDDFWRRFSMVAKEENYKDPKKKKSSWLSKTQGGSSRMSACVWITSVIILICIAGAIAVGWYFTHNTPAALPVAVGGSANETKGGASATKSTSSTAVPTTTTTGTRGLSAPTTTGTRPVKRRLERDLEDLL